MKRISSITGVRVLPFWQAPKYTPGGMNEVRAAAWHFAQGGGTDSWLTRLDGAQGNNSCHIVVKYDGSIRQLVEFDDASWSLHISYDAETSNDAPDYGIFGLRYVKDALGAGWSDPNRYIVAIEIEGFYQNGPNEAQKLTIVRLAKFLEAEFPKLVHLGHRDFQDYKPCPGPTLFRGLLPHAGRLTRTVTPTPEEESPDMSIKVTETLDTGWRIDVDGGVEFYNDRNCTDRLGVLPSPRDAAHNNALIYVGRPVGVSTTRVAVHVTGYPYEDGMYPTQVYFKDADVSAPYRVPKDTPTVDPNPALVLELEQVKAALLTTQAALTEANADLTQIKQIASGE
jgi:hypothetical protein